MALQHLQHSIRPICRVMTPLQQNEFLARFMGWEDEVMGFCIVPSIPPFCYIEDNGGIVTDAESFMFHLLWDWFQKAYQKYRTDFPTNPEVQGQIERFFTTNDLPSAVETLIQAIKENEHHITTPNFPTS
jgi:hypothetical protein